MYATPRIIAAMERTFGERIRERRRQLSLSQDELGRRLGGLSRSYVCDVETGRRMLASKRIPALAHVLGLSAMVLRRWAGACPRCGGTGRAGT